METLGAVLAWLILRAPSAIISEYVKQWWFRSGNLKYEAEIKQLKTEVSEYKERFSTAETLYLRAIRSVEAAADRIDELEAENENLRTALATRPATLQLQPVEADAEPMRVEATTAAMLPLDGPYGTASGGRGGQDLQGSAKLLANAHTVGDQNAE